jgi:hypothetical protein
MCAQDVQVLGPETTSGFVQVVEEGLPIPACIQGMGRSKEELGDDPSLRGGLAPRRDTDADVGDVFPEDVASMSEAVHESRLSGVESRVAGDVLGMGSRGDPRDGEAISRGP